MPQNIFPELTIIPLKNERGKLSEHNWSLRELETQLGNKGNPSYEKIIQCDLDDKYQLLARHILYFDAVNMVFC